MCKVEGILWCVSCAQTLRILKGQICSGSWSFSTTSLTRKQEPGKLGDNCSTTATVSTNCPVSTNHITWGA